MKAKPRLGKGIDALIPAEAHDSNTHVIELSLEEIRPNPIQPRKSIDRDKLAELSESIKVHGLISPILVRKFNTKYEIIAGERRFHACKLAGNQGINCTFDCPSYLVAIADSEKLAECFDELITNATHWFDKPNKELKIKAMISLPGLLPNGLDPTKSYVLISVEDNGCGIPINEKGKIFDAFVGKYQHGTGLGLALVRRNIEGHGGEIFESGIPGKGADFRIYIPSSESCYRLPNDEN